MIRVVTADIAETRLEAVLRPVTADWSAVTAATRRLEVAAGAVLEQQCRSLGELPVGSAVITGGGDLPVKFMIHVVVRSVDEPVTVAGIRRGLANGLRRVSEWGIRQLALVPLGTGAGNLDAEESAAIMVPLLVAQSGSGLEDVAICVESEYEREAFARHLAAAGG